MPFHKLIYVESRIVLGSVSRLHRDKVGRLSQSIHNNPYGVVLSPIHRSTNHEVNINGLPLPSRNLNNLSKTRRLKMFCLNLLTIRTLGHIFCNVLLHAITPINLLKIMIHLGGTWVYGISGTMGLCNNHGPQIIPTQYTQPLLIPKYVITS
ncbi:hypothetical protein EJD97_019936, partial [Solanum chilense]